jgi:hypothetical protein
MRSIVPSSILCASLPRHQAAAYQLCVCEAFEEDKNDGNKGVEDAARVCAALAGATSEEGIVVDRTTYGENGRCSLSKSSCRALGGTAVLGLSSIVQLARGRNYCPESKSSSTA